MGKWYDCIRREHLFLGMNSNHINAVVFLPFTETEFVDNRGRDFLVGFLENRKMDVSSEFSSSK